jgi:hypothetical protein
VAVGIYNKDNGMDNGSSGKTASWKQQDRKKVGLPILLVDPLKTLWERIACTEGT